MSSLTQGNSDLLSTNSQRGEQRHCADTPTKTGQWRVYHRQQTGLGSKMLGVALELRVRVRVRVRVRIRIRVRARDKMLGAASELGQGELKKSQGIPSNLRADPSVRARTGLAQTRLGLAQTRLGLAQTRLGLAQTRLGLAQTRLGLGQG
jgi:hypothetical protein